jgi:ABC-2 type transport system permease protein
MNTQSNALSDSIEAQRAVPLASATRPLYWSVRRELMENRWIYIGQFGVAAVFLLGFLINVMSLPVRMREAASVKVPVQYWEAISMPYDIAAGALMGTLILMSLFYSADALSGERRDRSILFWKSLPVSDFTTVLAKASIPLVILPLLTFTVTVVLQLTMLVVSCIVLAASGMSVLSLWRDLSVFQMWWHLLYHLATAHAVWPFPVFCWLLLVSAWARRATLLWAALPVIAIGGFEKVVFHTARLLELVGNRLIGGNAPTDYTAGTMFPLGPMTHVTPIRFLAAPSTWIGLLFAVAFLAAAVQSRRYRGPI